MASPQSTPLTDTQFTSFAVPPSVLTHDVKQKSGGDGSMGFIERTPFLYKQIEALGIPARVWDQVIEKESASLASYGLNHYSETPPAFDQLVADYQLWKALDYARAEGMSDDAYVLGLLKQADAQYRASRSGAGVEDSDEDFSDFPELAAEG